MFIVIAYDIKNDKRRKKVADELENFGKRVQMSVFECFLDEGQLQELRMRLEDLIDMSEDHLRYYFLCRKDAAATVLDGRNVIYRDEDYFMV